MTMQWYQYCISMLNKTEQKKNILIINSIKFSSKSKKNWRECTIHTCNIMRKLVFCILFEPKWNKGLKLLGQKIHTYSCDGVFFGITNNYPDVLTFNSSLSISYKKRAKKKWKTNLERKTCGSVVINMQERVENLLSLFFF